ncbi:carboxypeptidase-like regulatory domain-containing protein [Streptomyces sp. NPDC047043]|uniref:carboxypeptidase-like regulatory domain-containing protein n=1 Tax=Streptomyces sp. NPDC047043 TaxID=3154497 RepID=UPI0033F6072E
MPKLTIQVFLGPSAEEGLVPETDTWPTPEGVFLELRKKGGAKDAGDRPPIEAGPSDEYGLVAYEKLPAGTYTVAVKPGTAPPAFAALRVLGDGDPAELVVPPGTGTEVQALLLPDIGERLVTLRAQTRDGQPVPGAAVDVQGTSYTSRSDGYIHVASKEESIEIMAHPTEAHQPLEILKKAEVGHGGPVTVEYRAVHARLVIRAAVNAMPVSGVVFELTRADGREGLQPERRRTDDTGLCFFDQVQEGMVGIAVVDVSGARCGGRPVTVDPKYRRTALRASPGSAEDLSEHFRFAPAPDGGPPGGLRGPEKRAVTGHVRDRAGDPVEGMNVVLYSADEKVRVGSARTDGSGGYRISVRTAGTYRVCVLGEDGEPGEWATVKVSSEPVVDFTVVRPSGSDSHKNPSPIKRELSDLSAFPVLTEEIGGGGRAPIAGGGDRSAGYGQIVEGALRDVLGWRPGSNTSGFQAALNGAFELRDVQGHTEFTWHPRGYAVQADLGALTGAQASIYNRAKNALEQITPLLDGLTPLDPAADPQDTEAIRTIVRAELGELVDELAVEGGPRIQRVDELFTLLIGPGSALNPDAIGGQLLQLRDRFGLTTSRVGTLDEERIVTNFRIVVDHVLALRAGWDGYRRLFDDTTSDTSLGTVLIRLSRSLDVVAQSVEETVFTLDSVFIDAAQRQTIRLEFPARGTEPKPPSILLSDLLDWVSRVATEEGPRLIRDAGKDGVIAITGVLTQLADLVHRTRQLTRHGTMPGGERLPDGMRTPRVRRALQELEEQLDDTVSLARAVQRTEPPFIIFVNDVSVGESGELDVTLVGRGFLPGATAELSAVEDPDLPVLLSRDAVNTGRPGRAVATFDPLPPDDDLTWVVTLINPGGIRSNTVEALTT